MFGSRVFKKEDEAIIDRCIPKSVSKQHAKGVARLYVAYPDPSRWTYTGLQGAIVLCEDTTVPSLWLKMVDISVSSSAFRPDSLPQAYGCSFCSSPPTAVSSGIKKSTKTSSIPCYVLSSIHSICRLSIFKSATRGCYSPMRTRRRSSTSQCKRARNM